MSDSFFVQISDPEDLSVVVCVPSQYSPDVLDDIQRRCVELYKQALSFRFALDQQSSRGIYADLEQILADDDDEDYEEGDE